MDSNKIPREGSRKELSDLAFSARYEKKESLLQQFIRTGGQREKHRYALKKYLAECWRKQNGLFWVSIHELKEHFLGGTFFIVDEWEEPSRVEAVIALLEYMINLAGKE